MKNFMIIICALLLFIFIIFSVYGFVRFCERIEEKHNQIRYFQFQSDILKGG